MPLDAEQQRSRYLAKALCGNCGRKAAAMRSWGTGRRIPICVPCGARLDEVLRELEEMEEERLWEAERGPELDPDEY